MSTSLTVAKTGSSLRPNEVVASGASAGSAHLFLLLPEIEKAQGSGVEEEVWRRGKE